jgi:hypothetical protein
LGFGFGLAVRTKKPKAEAHSRKKEEKGEKREKGIFGFGRWEAVRIDLTIPALFSTEGAQSKSS